VQARLKPLFVCFLAACSFSVLAGERRTLHGHLRPEWRKKRSVEEFSGTNQIKLAIGLPLRNRQALSRFLSGISDPGSPNYRHYLTPAEFAEDFGPSVADYRAAIDFAKTNGLQVTATHPNRMLLEVSASAKTVNKAFQIKLLSEQHPTEARKFFRPDRDPSIPANAPILHVSGLDDFIEPQPRNLHRTGVTDALAGKPRAGSGPSGAFMGNDFRKAYVPGTSLTGEGQSLGLFELDGYYPSDITSYASTAGLTNVPLRVVLIDGFKGVPLDRRPGSGNEEVALDIEVALSMAPGISEIIVYEGTPRSTMATINHILNQMATDNAAKQLSCSWGFDIDITTEQIFQQFAAQGQSFFLASGDTGAFSSVVELPSDDPNITIVGGTTLLTDASGLWKSERAWYGSGGGISTVYSIPAWQQGLDFKASKGSSTMRNIPDVAMVGDNVFAMVDRGASDSFFGTSISAPLWAAFTALVNEQGAAMGRPPVGFINPALYAIGKSSQYSRNFHDIVAGDNTTDDSPDLFFAVPGYDLCTGWGSPRGTNLINALLAAPSEPLVVKSPLGFIANGPAGGPFIRNSQIYVLENTGSAPLTWSASTTSQWFDVFPVNGGLAAGGKTNVTVQLNPAVTNILIGEVSANLVFLNETSGVKQPLELRLISGNGGFENGDFSNWTLTGTTSANYVISIDNTSFTGTSAIPGVDDPQFIRSGLYGAFLGQSTTLGSLTQTLPTLPGRNYSLSFWLNNPAEGVPNEFRAAWDSTILFDQVNMGPFAWTNMQFAVSATTTNSVLKFSFRNDLTAFALDGITLELVPSEMFQNITAKDGAVELVLNIPAGQRYQLQFAPDLNSMLWTTLGDPGVGGADPITIFDSIGSSEQRYYRIIIASP
jgi:hypothetical protein